MVYRISNIQLMVQHVEIYKTKLEFLKYVQNIPTPDL